MFVQYPGLKSSCRSLWAGAAVSVGRHIRAAEGSAQLWVRQIRSARALYIRPQRKFAWSSSFQISVILLALLSVVSPFFLFPLG